MCGIFCLLAKHDRDETIDNILKSCQFYLDRRGPDFQQRICLDIEGYKCNFAASVLWLQGQSMSKQPIVNDRSCFIFNGDIFGGLSDEDRILYGDTPLLLKELESADNVRKVLSSVHGPYAFIYLDKDSLKLYFGRDIFGRRSLLIGKINDNLLLTSVASKDIELECIELPAIGTFCFDLKTKNFTLYPWYFKNNNFYDKVYDLKLFLNTDICVDQEIPMISNKAFTSPSVYDLEIFDEIKGLNKDECFSLLLSDLTWISNVDMLGVLLEQAIDKRISNQPQYCQNCLPTRLKCNHALIGVLFSGGLDCTIIALLASKYYDSERPIDLINVAFGRDKGYNTPDRQTGLDSYQELQKICLQRKWNFISVNITETELNYERSNHIKHLIYPLNSIMDDNLGSALWFAARGINEENSSSCRVLLVGMGADELFGGYTRHRAALKRNSWEGLHDVLNEDWQNISHRNLARDDRVVSDHGRQLRTPYLDEDVVTFSRNLDCWHKTCPSDFLPQGVGEKILLRALAYKLGLRGASVFKKRALQFGCRIADKKENAYEVSPRL